MENYQEFIQNILETRGRFVCGDEYHERHHILPKCMGGTNDEDNLIDLFAREHFEAHRLLALENPDNDKLVYAYTCMAFLKNDYEHRYKLSPEEYEEARKIHAEMISNRYIGEGNPFYGKNHTEKTRQKIRELNSGRVFSEETRKKMSESLSGERNPMFGKHLTQEQIDNMKQKMSGENNPMYGISPKERMDEETYNLWKKHLSEKLSGENNPMFGKTRSEEFKEKNRQSHLGKKASENTKKKMSISHQGKTWTKEQREKMSGENHPMHGRHHSKESKEKISCSKSGYNAKHTNPIINIDTNNIYYSSSIAENDTNIDQSSILKCCKGVYKTAGGYNWKYIYDYITKDGTIIPGAIALGIITEEEYLKNIKLKEN